MSTEFSAKLEQIRAACVFQCNTVEEARNALAELKLKEQELKLLKSDIKVHMQHIRQAYTAGRATTQAAWYSRHASSDRANKRQILSHQEVNVLAPYEQETRNVDQLVQWLEHRKLEINQWMTAHK